MYAWRFAGGIAIRSARGEGGTELSEKLLKWRGFETAVADTIRLCGFEAVHDVKLQGRQTDIFSRSNDPLTQMRIIVECKSSIDPNKSLPVSEISEFCARLALARTTGVAELGWIVTNMRIPANAYSVIRDSHLTGCCRIISHDELLAQIIDFQSYWKRVAEYYPGSRDQYIDPSIKLVKTHLRDATTTSLSEFMNQWLDDPNDQLLVLLGDYGQGKTSFCLDILRAQLETNSASRHRYPLFLRLRDVANQGYLLPAIMRVGLHEQFGLEYRSYETLMQMARRGNLLVIFDGLDEICFSMRWSEIFESIRQLAAMILPNNKVIITSRPGIFPQPSKIAEMLSQTISKRALRSTTIASIEYFDEKRIRRMLASHGFSEPDKIYDHLSKIDGLNDLLVRPITLNMTIETLKTDSKPLEQISTSAELYYQYTDQWMDRDTWRSLIARFSSEAGRDIKSNFVESLAWHMFKSGSLRVSAEFIDQHVREYFKNYSKIDDLIPAFANEIKICSFLDWKLDGTIQFSHSSFFDFFVARLIMNHSVRAMIAILSEHALNSGILRFLLQEIDFRSVFSGDAAIEAMVQPNYFGLNYIRMLDALGEQLLLTTAFPAGAIVSFSSARPVVLTVRASTIETLELTSTDSLVVELEDCTVRDLKLSGKERCQLVLKGSRVHNLRMTSIAQALLTAERSELVSGDLFYDTLELKSIDSHLARLTIEEALERLAIADEEGPVTNITAFLKKTGLTSRQSIGRVMGPKKGARRARRAQIILDDEDYVHGM